MRNECKGRIDEEEKGGEEEAKEQEQEWGKNRKTQRCIVKAESNQNWAETSHLRPN